MKSYSYESRRQRGFRRYQRKTYDSMFEWICYTYQFGWYRRSKLLSLFYTETRAFFNVITEWRIIMNIENYKDYNFIPIYREIYADVITPITLLRKIAASYDDYYLLESVEGGNNWSRYSFLGYNPLFHIIAKDDKAFIKSKDNVTPLDKAPVDALKELISKYRSPKIKGLPTFTGGLVGYFSYEMIHYAEPKLHIKPNEFNDYDLMLFDKVIAYDHLKQKIIIMANMNPDDGQKGYDAAMKSIDEIMNLIYDTTPLPDLYGDENVLFTCNTTEDEYAKMVNKTIDYIREGDIFQAVISRRFEADYYGSLLNAYRVLRTTNPSPYMYFISSDSLQITGASPETMVKVIDGQITTFPVAGTRKRGRNDEEDDALEKSLMSDEKELAEHNMLVDLARNDVGKISEYKSVYLKDYMKIHKFSKVMHIASTVCGTLKSDKSSYDAISALLPAGTLSGAPKFRACEIIDELEPVSRGVYGGAIGYIDFSGNLDVCIAIRTAVKKGNTAYVQAGAGIVADSVPANEYQECANKAGAIIDAIIRAREVNGR